MSSCGVERDTRPTIELCFILWYFWAILTSGYSHCTPTGSTKPHLLYHLHLEGNHCQGFRQQPRNQAPLWTDHRNMTGYQHNLGAETQTTTRRFLHVIIWNRGREKWTGGGTGVLGEPWDYRRSAYLLKAAASIWDATGAGFWQTRRGYGFARYPKHVWRVESWMHEETIGF